MGYLSLFTCVKFFIIIIIFIDVSKLKKLDVHFASHVTISAKQQEINKIFKTENFFLLNYLFFKKKIFYVIMVWPKMTLKQRK